LKVTTAVTGPLSDRSRTKDFVREFERVLARELRPIAIKHGESVAQRALDNASNRGRGPGNLRHHRPIGLKKNFRVAVAKRAEMERQLRTANTSAPGMFEVQFNSSNSLVNWMAEMLEGKNDRVKGNIERPGYGKQPKVTLKPTKAKNFLIPNMRAKFGGAATRLLTDIAARDSRDPKRRYVSFRSRSGRRRLTDQRPTGGFRWFVAGGKLSARLRIPKGIYLSPTRRRSGRDTKLILAYYLKPEVKVRPNAWFSSALNDWFVGRGGRNTFASMSSEIEVATEKAWEEAFATKTTEKKGS
jgi:hypothetical protein